MQITVCSESPFESLSAGTRKYIWLPFPVLSQGPHINYLKSQQTHAYQQFFKKNPFFFFNHICLYFLLLIMILEFAKKVNQKSGGKETAFCKSVTSTMLKNYLCSLHPETIVIKISAFFSLTYANFGFIHMWLISI